MMYCIRAVAPGRSGWLSPILRVSSSHSWVSHFDMRSPCVRPRPARSTRTLPLATGVTILATGAGEVTDPGEQVVLRDGTLHQAAGQDVVVVGVHGAGHLGRQPEPERGGRVDLCGVGDERLAANLGVVADLDSG